MGDTDIVRSVILSTARPINSPHTCMDLAHKYLKICAYVQPTRPAGWWSDLKEAANGLLSAHVHV